MTKGVNGADSWCVCVCVEGYSERRLRDAAQCLLFSPVKYLRKRREKNVRRQTRLVTLYFRISTSDCRRGKWVGG